MTEINLMTEVNLMTRPEVPPKYSRVSALLQHHRNKKQLTVQELAKEIGYSPKSAFLSQILTGRKELPFDKIAVVSYRLNIPIDELLLAICDDYQSRLVLSVGERWPHLQKNLFLIG